MTSSTREGYLYGLGAYGLWGLVPLYFKAVHRDVGAIEMLAHRILWTLAFLAVVAGLSRRWADIRACFRTRKLVVPLVFSSCMIAVNWLMYIASVANGEIRQASLGYFITPLASVVLGLLVLHEHLRRLQWLAVALAALGVCLLMVLLGKVPWLAFTIAASFSIYSLIRKKVPVDGLVGLVVEASLLAPVALVFLVVWNFQGKMAFLHTTTATDILLICCGPVTALPLLCFGQAARRLPLSTLGFMQFSSPTIQLILAVAVYDESVETEAWISFSIIWLALVLFTIDSFRAKPPTPASTDDAA